MSGSLGEFLPKERRVSIRPKFHVKSELWVGKSSCRDAGTERKSRIIRQRSRGQINTILKEHMYIGEKKKKKEGCTFLVAKDT